MTLEQSYNAYKIRYSAQIEFVRIIMRTLGVLMESEVSFWPLGKGWEARVQGNGETYILSQTDPREMIYICASNGEETGLKRPLPYVKREVQKIFEKVVM